MSMFKNEIVIKLFFNKKLEKLIAKNLITNIQSHWSEEIKIISKLVLAKFLSSDIEFLEKINIEDRKIIENLNLTEYNEELWGVHFDLKAD